MGIVHMRIDDRLIHGQVAGMWASYVSATRIIVVDDDAPNDEMQKIALRLATPAGIALSIFNRHKAVERLKSGAYDAQRVLVVSKSPDYLVYLMEHGISFDAVNVGNMTYDETKVSLGKTVSLTKDDIINFRKLMDSGVHVTMRLVPANEPREMHAALEHL